MSNGLSYPEAKKIYNKSMIKQKTTRVSLFVDNLHEDSIYTQNQDTSISVRPGGAQFNNEIGGEMIDLGDG